MISANVLKINQITSDIALEIQNSLRSSGNNKINIALGSITGINILAGIGPKIPVRISTAGNVETNLKSEFISKGINQTLHRVYLEVDSNVSILTPTSSIEESISNQVLILENVIVGEIPNNYYNFEGINSDSEVLEVVE
jgi:sporulation protein YunB